MRLSDAECSSLAWATTGEAPLVCELLHRIADRPGPTEADLFDALPPIEAAAAEHRARRLLAERYPTLTVAT